MNDKGMILHYDRRKLFLTALLLLIIFVGGIFFAWLTVFRADHGERESLLQQAHLVAQAISVERIKTFLGTAADLENPSYLRLKEQIAAIRSANPLCRFIYLMGRKTDGTVFFFVDSEPVTSQDYSPPGQIYEEVSEEYRQVFDTKAAIVEGPVTDRWGTWVSALVPMSDPQTDTVIAVLGMDIDAHIWKQDVISKAVLPIGLMFVLLIVVVSFLISTRHIDTSPKPVLRRLLPALMSIMILLVVGGEALLYWQYQQKLAENSASLSGDLLIMHDISEKAGFTRLMSFSATGGVVLLTLLLGFIYVLLRRTDEGIRAQQEKIKQAKEYAETIFKLTPSAIFTVDTHKRVTSWNRKAEELTGFTAEETIGKECVLFTEAPCKEKCGLFSEDVKKPMTDRECTIRTKNGQLLFISKSVDVLKNEKGDIVGGIESFEDITDRKAAEETIQKALANEKKSHEIMVSMLEDNNQVREKLEKNLEELKKIQIQLIQAGKMEVVGRMAAGVAHEVKNPLGIILQGVDYLERVVPPEEQGHREIIRTIRENVERADRIVRSLLDFSRSQEPEMDLQDISAVLEGALGLVQHRLKIHSVEVVHEFGKNLPKLLMDRGMIEQVLINLFNNAADAMPEGGKLYVRASLKKMKTAKKEVGDVVESRFRLGEEVVMVEVEDTGMGMDEHLIRKMFDPFFTTKKRTEGTGLGLSVARSIMAMHQGLIEAENEKGKGLKMTLIFKIPGKTG